MASKKLGKSSSTLISFPVKEKPHFAKNSSDMTILVRSKNTAKTIPRSSGVE